MIKVCKVKILMKCVHSFGTGKHKLQADITLLFQYRSAALVRELLSNNLLFVSQLYEDKLLALHAHDLIFFTTDLQTVNYYTTIHC